MRGLFMLASGAGLLSLLILLAPPPAMAAEGVFEGKVIDPPAGVRLSPGWIFVLGRNQLLRRVEVAHAVIVFAQPITPSQRRKCGSECLEVGQEIRVTADQDSAGEWRARRVEILRLTTRGTSAKTASLSRSSGQIEESLAPSQLQVPLALPNLTLQQAGAAG